MFSAGVLPVLSMLVPFVALFLIGFYCSFFVCVVVESGLIWGKMQFLAFSFGVLNLNGN